MSSTIIGSFRLPLLTVAAAVIAALVPGGGDLLALGVPMDGAWWSVLTYGAVHRDTLHLATNIVALWTLAAVILRQLPQRAFAISGIWFVGGICGGGLAFAATSTAGTSLTGCSAGVMALGALATAVSVFNAKWLYAVVCALLTLAGWFGGDWAAHTGGIIAGISGVPFLLVFLKKKHAIAQRQSSESDERQYLNTIIDRSGFESLSARQRERYFQLHR